MIERPYSKDVTDLDALNSAIEATGLPRYPTTGFRFYGCGCTEWPPPPEGQGPTTTVYCADDLTPEEGAVIDAVVGALP